MNVRIESGLTALLDNQGAPLSVVERGVFDIFLSPFYAMEQDVVFIYAEEGEEYYQKVRHIIFEASMRADHLLTPQRISSFGLSKQESFMLKRNYTICKAVYEFGKIFNRDYLQSVKKSKFLGDVKVSLDIEKDPTLIKQIADDAKHCFKELEGMFEIGSGMSSFVKGRSNPCNQQSHRQWWPSEGSGNPRVSIAATKAAGFCRKYKIGVN